MDFMNWNVQALHLWILSGSRLTLVYLYYTHACPTLIFLVFHSYVFLYKGTSFTIYLWSTDAAPLRCRTRVRRVRDAAARAFGHVMPRGFFFLKPTRTNAAPTRADSRWIGPTRAWIGRNRWNSRFRPKFKKKKKVQNAPFELNLKPSFSSLHTNMPNFLY